MWVHFSSTLHPPLPPWPQALKNLVYLARVLHRSHVCERGTNIGINGRRPSDEEEGEEEAIAASPVAVAAKPRDLMWLVQKICRIARLEAGNRPKEPHKVRTVLLRSYYDTCLWEQNSVCVC